MALTQISGLDLEVEGYILIVPLPDHTKKAIHALQHQITRSIPAEDLWLPTEEQLHMTFAHVVSPDIEYEAARGELFAGVRAQVSRELQVIAAQLAGDTVHFKGVSASTSAIYIFGDDNGAIQEARQYFKESIPIPKGTRKPPSINHVTIARYRNPIDLSRVEKAVEGLSIETSIPIEKLQLVKEHILYCQTYTVLEEYPA